MKKLIVHNANSHVHSERLQRVIAKKRKQLQTLTARYELLKMRLDDIQREYMTRIGELYRKDNELDMAILRCQMIQKFIADGMTYEEAIAKLDDTHESEPFFSFDDMQPEQEAIFVQEEEVGNQHKKIKQLWKQLIMEFHPDLTTDPKEKVHREEIMRSINKAYSDRDYETLKALSLQQTLRPSKEITIPKLEQIIVDLENLLIQKEQQLIDLKTSEWYGWKKSYDKAKRKGEDIFRELERKLLDTVAEKISILHALQAKLHAYATA